MENPLYLHEIIIMFFFFFFVTKARTVIVKHPFNEKLLLA
ncbi:unnamed protein product [Brassica rapa]|uniref:Uncharacterized protein n=1 Tax=Brassica campestris TaxID=3711 RepID=A0A8D9LWU9_BRACM|nr:unnamed protein product [Brassica rapa]